MRQKPSPRNDSLQEGLLLKARPRIWLVQIQAASFNSLSRKEIHVRIECAAHMFHYVGTRVRLCK